MQLPQASIQPSHGDLIWSDWRSQMRHRITTVEQLRRWINVAPQEEEAIARTASKYRWSVTPYYASLMDRADPACPIRQQAIPSLRELEPDPRAEIDPMGDTTYRKTNRIVHKYPDRVIFLITQLCPVYCRHCTRKYHTTDLEGTYFQTGEAASFDEDFEYIQRHPEIRDVLLTGGDPLSYGDEKLDHLLCRLRRIPHVEIIRIGSRYPVLLPQRITDDLCATLEKHHPLWFSTHFNHPQEITAESAAACDKLLRSGIVVQNQSVLLKGINDNVETMAALLTGLVKIRVRPYYLYHCDPVTGVSHFGTTIEAGRALMAGLFGHLSGFAVPQYVIDTAIGKIPLMPQSVELLNAAQLLVRNYKGQTAIVPNL